MGININDINKNKQQPKENSSGLFDYLNKDISFSNKFNIKKKEHFFSQLGILLSSGIDLRSALDIIVEGQDKEKVKIELEKIRKDVINGVSLSSAVDATGKFSTYDYYNLRVGEESGELTTVLKELGGFYQKRIKQKQQIISALTYPSVIIITAVVVVTFMLNYMVPMFVDIFSKNRRELPSITKFIIKVSDFFTANALWFLLVILLLLLIGFISRNKRIFRKYSSKILLKTPIFGALIKAIYFERFFFSMSLLIRSKVNLVEAVKIIIHMLRFFPLEESLKLLKEDLLKGVSIHESLKKNDLFDKRIISLVKVGEEVNKLDDIFANIGGQLSDEIDNKIGTLGSLIEPLLIIFIGLFVAIILIAMYLPMFQIGTAIQ